MRDFFLADFKMNDPIIDDSPLFTSYLAGLRSHLNYKPLEESDNIK